MPELPYEDENTEVQVRKATENLGPASPSVARALREVPRQLFRSSELSLLSYGDSHIPVAEGRSLQPIEVTAKMLAALELDTSSSVLEIGTGVGYLAALLSKLSRHVYSIDRLESLVNVARRNLDTLDVRNVTLCLGETTIGLKEKGPYDAILISASGLKVPGIIREQLAVGGRLIMPVGAYRDRQMLVRVRRKSKTEFVEEHLGQLRFVMRLGDILVDLGIADRQDVEQAALRAAATDAPMGEVIRQVAKVEEPDIYRVLAAQRGLKFGTVDALLKNVDLELVRGVARSFMEYNQVIPIARKDGRLTLATFDPDPTMADLSQAFHPDRLDVCLVTPTDYRRLWSAIDRMLSGKEAPDAVKERQDEHVLTSVTRGSEEFFIHLFESLLLDAIGERASDIHLEQYGERIRIRIRVDGDMRDLPRYRMTPADLAGVMNVIKVRSKLDIAEHRLPQGGRMRVKAGGKTFDLRVQVQPSLYGEYAVIRILPEDIHVLSIDDLGFSEQLAARYRNILEQPSGLVLVVGPTGSGKTTTLYAGLEILSQDATRKVITVEDPIEYAIENVQQTTARPDIGFTFADAIRSFLRLDPDVILVGEIRDHETALEAIRASQTGHLVFSTLHCNDTTDAVQRLFDLGMNSNSICSELVGVLSQRLPRRICESCKIEARPDKELLNLIFPQGAPKGFKSFAGKGCTRCRGYGTYGRIACVEFLTVDTKMRMAISRHPPLDELRGVAVELGLKTMREAALDLVSRELIALSELPTILSTERLGPERDGQQPAAGS